MNIITSFLNLNDKRINLAQSLFLSSIVRFQEVTPIIVPGSPRPKFNDLLQTARSLEKTEWFGWINSDCQLLLPPSFIFNNIEDVDVVGLLRTELGTGKGGSGVDGYFIKNSFYDNHLKKGPSLWIGATHIDWWVTRAAKKFGKYTELFCLAHIPHDRTVASIGLDEIGKQNIDAFNEWADKNVIPRHDF